MLRVTATPCHPPGLPLNYMHMKAEAAETLDECLARVQMMASGDSTWDLSDNDRHALKKTLMEIIHLRENLHDLKEAISPGQKYNVDYYVAAAKFGAT